MRAVWYERYGPADAVLTIGELDVPVPGPGEVLIRVRASGINPSDVKLRAGLRPGVPMPFPRIIPHSDGAGVIEDGGPGVDNARIGQRVWVHNAGWERANATCAEYVALPAALTVPLSDRASFAEGACFGIPAMTAWYALFGDGADLAGQTVLVTGGAGTVGRYACQMAALAGARVITTVSSEEKARHSTAEHWIDYRREDVIAGVNEITKGEGVDRIVDVDFAANQDISLDVLKIGGTISAYASSSNVEPELKFYRFMFRNITLRMLIAYLIPPEVHARGAAQLHTWLEAGALSHAVVPGGSLADVVSAHERVESGGKLGTVVLEV